MAEKEKKKLQFTALFKGIAFSIAMTLILILVITCVCYWGNVSEKILGLMLFAASAVSVLFSSILMTKSIKHSGLIYGALNGLGYFIVIFVAAICFSGKFAPSAQSITMLAGAVLAGALGGVMGVNKA